MENVSLLGNMLPGPGYFVKNRGFYSAILGERFFVDELRNKQAN